MVEGIFDLDMDFRKSAFFLIFLPLIAKALYSFAFDSDQATIAFIGTVSSLGSFSLLLLKLNPPAKLNIGT